MPSPTLDSVSDGFLSVLFPGGVGVGTLKNVTKRSPEVPYVGATPALIFPPLSGPAGFGGVAARTFAYRGWIVLTYLDTDPSQQGVPLATIETAMTANMEAIIQAIMTNPTLGGAVVRAGAIPAAHGSTFSGGEEIKIHPYPGGPIADKFGAMWVTFSLSVPFIGQVTHY